MRIVLQRVKEARVVVNSQIVASIGQGFVLLVGFGGQDDRSLPHSEHWKTCINKLPKLRVFPDEEGKSNLSLEQIEGAILVISQFTLYADWRKGRRPSFTAAAPPELARYLYDCFLKDVQLSCPERVSAGIFGAEMDLNLTNWGPLTLFWDTEKM